MDTLQGARDVMRAAETELSATLGAGSISTRAAALIASYRRSSAEGREALALAAFARLAVLSR